jgi:hypothetical protein
MSMSFTVVLSFKEGQISVSSEMGPGHSVTSRNGCSIAIMWALVQNDRSLTICEMVLNELYFWTLSIVWCPKKLRNKIYIPTKSQYTCPKFTQGSITNHRATYLGAHTT